MKKATDSVRVPPLANDHFGYRFEIAILGGGIQPANDDFTYLAPETGYSSSINVVEHGDSPKWHPNIDQEYYIKTPDGHFGRLHVGWEAWQTPPTHLEWNCSINSSGSRNLER